MSRCHSSAWTHGLAEVQLLHAIAEKVHQLREGLAGVPVHVLPARRLHEGEERRDGGLRGGDLSVARIRRGARVGIARVVPHQHLGQQRHVLEGAREHAHVIERARELEHAVARDQAVGGLEAEDAAVGGGPDHRTAGLAAHRQRHLARRHRRRRAAGGAAGSMRGVHRIARLARRARGELGGHRLAQEHRARRAQPLHHRGVPRGHAAGVQRRAVLGRHVRGVDDVLEAHRHPVERSGGRARAARLVGRARLRERVLRIQIGPGLELGFRRLHPGQAGLDQGGGVQRPFTDQAGGGGGGQAVEVSFRRGIPAARATCPARCT